MPLKACKGRFSSQFGPLDLQLYLATNHSAHLINFMLKTCKQAYIATALALAWLLACSGTQAKEQEAAPTVILIAWSGMRHDYPDLDSFPGLDRLMAEGARALRMRPVYPSDTFPNTISIATGTYPDVHGIIANNFYDKVQGDYNHEQSPTSDWLLAEPLWLAAERQGVRAAVHSWIGSEGSWREQKPSYQKSHYLDTETEAKKVKQILKWLDLPEEKKPGLIMSWWKGANFLAIRQGPNHPAIKKRVRKHDNQLWALLKGIDKRGLWPNVTLLLVSDHGLTEISKFINVDEMLAESAIGAKTAGGPSLQHIYLDDLNDLEAAHARLAANSNLQVRRLDEWPAQARFAYKPRMGDLTVAVAPPYSLISPTKGQLAGHGLMAVLSGWRLGMHGYDAAHPDMAGLFLAVGRGVQAGLKLPEVRVIDVAPTIASLLGIHPPAQSEGRSLFLLP